MSNGRITRSQGAAQALNKVANKTASSRGLPTEIKETGNSADPSDIAYLEAINSENDIPKHPVEVGKILIEAGFGECQEITKLGKLRFKLNLKRADDFYKLEKIDLKNFNLKLYCPKFTKETILFVRNVPLDFDEEDLKQYVQCEAEVLQIERIKRKGPGDELLKTQNIKVTIKGKQIPKTLKIYGVNFHTELYIFPVKQCTSCWRFGHTRKACRGNAKCKNCGEPESDEHSICKNQTRCLNCKQNHQAGNKSCPERNRRHSILRIMAEKHMTYEEAQREWPNTSNYYAILAETMDHEEPRSFEAPSYRYHGTRSKRNQSKCEPAGMEQRNRQSSSHQRTNIQNSHSEIHEIGYFENGQKATEFERCMAELRRLFLNSHSSCPCIGKLKTLRDQINSKLQQNLEEIETDQLLILVATELSLIINPVFTEQIETSRIEASSNNDQ